MKVSKPWGWYEVLKQGKGWKLKFISLNPHSRTSLQSHKLRDEIWYEVEDVNNCKYIKRLDKVRVIRKGEKHRAESGSKGRVFFEVQIGKCIESDIKRYEDDYGRVKKCSTR